ncbi:unnamed protein product [Lactuca virosa]|uniref:Uncharacterized protein n=1 Tax=Lactuca virosa TaxID=75947 RepID=A0AAU9PDB0_9ASTR|nr:unnamed protein product [Lactuca virosa]
MVSSFPSSMQDVFVLPPISGLGVKNQNIEADNSLVYLPVRSWGSFATCGRRESMEDTHFLMPHVENQKDVHMFGSLMGTEVVQLQDFVLEHSERNERRSMSSMIDVPGPVMVSRERFGFILNIIDTPGIVEGGYVNDQALDLIKRSEALLKVVESGGRFRKREVKWQSIPVVLVENSSTCWKAYLWLPFIPLIIILIVGTKLQVIITKMGRRTREMANVVKGTPMVQPGDDLFWFGRPKLVLILINFCSFSIRFI